MTGTLFRSSTSAAATPGGTGMSPASTRTVSREVAVLLAFLGKVKVTWTATLPRWSLPRSSRMHEGGPVNDGQHPAGPAFPDRTDRAGRCGQLIARGSARRRACPGAGCGHTARPGTPGYRATSISMSEVRNRKVGPPGFEPALRIPCQSMPVATPWLPALMPRVLVRR